MNIKKFSRRKMCNKQDHFEVPKAMQTFSHKMNVKNWKRCSSKFIVHDVLFRQIQTRKCFKENFMV